MTKPLPSSLSAYQRGARAVGAKAALPFAAGVAALAGQSAQGQVVTYVPTTHNVAQLGSGHAQLFVDFFGGQVGYSSFGSENFAISINASGGGDTDGVTANFTFGFLGDPFPGGYAGKFADEPNQTNGGYGYLGNFTRGTLFEGSKFGDSQPYMNPPNAGVAPVWANATGYAGVELYHNSQTYYGWLKLAVNGDGSEISLLAFGYNQTAGTTITAGEGLTPVPEPASAAALLAAGAAGLAIYRRRKQIVRAA